MRTAVALPARWILLPGARSVAGSRLCPPLLLPRWRSATSSFCLIAWMVSAQSVAVLRITIQTLPYHPGHQAVSCFIVSHLRWERERWPAENHAYFGQFGVGYSRVKVLVFLLRISCFALRGKTLYFVPRSTTPQTAARCLTCLIPILCASKVCKPQQNKVNA
jgi:hypothetical protein